MAKKIHIREVGLREGFQHLAATYPLHVKFKLLESLVKSGLSEIEVTSLVRADKVPQLADGEELCRLAATIKNQNSCRFTALYLNQKGFIRGEQISCLQNDGWISIALSETFLKNNNNLTLAQLYESVEGWEKTFQSHGKKVYGVMVSTAFGCNEEGAEVKNNLSKILLNVTSKLSYPITEVCLADTMGWGTPDVVRSSIHAVRTLIPNVEVSLHLHNTRGMGIANAYAGLCEGVTVFDSSFGGVGGCPFARGASGNIATEELLFLLDQMGFETGVNRAQIIATCALFEELTGVKMTSAYRAL